MKHIATNSCVPCHLGLQHCLPVELMPYLQHLTQTGAADLLPRTAQDAPASGLTAKSCGRRAQMPPVDVDAHTTETKLDIIKMNMKIEFQDIVMIRKMALKSKENTMDLYQTLNDDDLFGQPDGIDIRTASGIVEGRERWLRGLLPRHRWSTTCKNDTRGGSIHSCAPQTADDPCAFSCAYPLWRGSGLVPHP